jgi:hypothetical protein
MTEAEWATCTEPLALWEFARDKISLRKYRLFTCACCRVAWEQIWPGRCRRAVLASERHAEGEITQQELLDARSEAYSVVHDQTYRQRHRGPGQPPFMELADPFLLAACDSAGYHPADLNRAVQFLMRAGVDASGLAQLFRDVAGFACFRSFNIDPAWLSWRDNTIQDMAKATYDDLTECYFDYHRLAVLADALEEAGCTNEDVLAHLRGPGPHVRGCWVVDLLLGKE